MSEKMKNDVPKIKKPIVLIGMMGAGKTHIGKLLANTLNVEFYDSDHVIEERGGLTINEIFELYGEERFRQSEEKTILELLDYKPCVIATGGGAPMNVNILSAAKEKGISIWLNSTVEEIYERIKMGKHRPLLKVEDPKAELSKLLEKRKDKYAQADINVKTDGKDAKNVLSEIIEALGNML